MKLLEDRVVPSLTTLATFDHTNGVFPLDSPVADSQGNVFGTAQIFGSSGGAEVYEIAKGSNAITVIASLPFIANAPTFPGIYNGGGLIVDSHDNLFGSLNSGVFEITAGSGTVTMLAPFDDTTGSFPGGPLFEDASGDLFGTTKYGGALGGGTAFELPAGGSHITALAALPHFGPFQLSPYNGVVADSAGNLFGTTQYGGANQEGSVFEVPADGGGTVTTLASFNEATGFIPDQFGPLVLDGSGNLYGVAGHGGASNVGTVFEIPASSRTSIVTIASFDGTTMAYPEHLYADTSGNLFGTTDGGYFGGTILGDGGSIFEIPAGSGTIVKLGSLVDNDYGITGLTQDNSGNLIGATEDGGPLDAGTIFEVPDPNPYAISQSSSMRAGQTQAVALQTTDPNGDLLTFTVTSPANGTLTGTAPNLIYTPNPGFVGTDSFQFTVTDTVTGLVSNAAAVSFAVHAPTAHIAPIPNATPAVDTVQFILSATDPTGPQVAAGFTYSVDWGDGTPPQTISASANNGNGVAVSHTYSTDGAYLVAVTATAADGPTSPAATAVAAVSSHAADTISLDSSKATAAGFSLAVDNVVYNGFNPTDLVFISGLGGNDTFTISLGNNFAIPIRLAGRNSGDTLVFSPTGKVVIGDNGLVITETPTQLVLGSPITETITKSGIPNTVIESTGQNNIDGLDVHLGGPTAGAQYGQLSADGTVNVAGTLQISLGYVPSPGDSFTIINNAGSNPINGTFAGLAEGSVITVNGTELVLTYQGGDGNDVVLTAVQPQILGMPATSPEGTPIFLTETAINPNTGAALAGLKFAWSVTKDGRFFGSPGFGASYNFTPDDLGTYLVTLTATDPLGGVVAVHESLSVTDATPTAAITNQLPSDASNNPTAPVGTLVAFGGVLNDNPSQSRALNATDLVSWTVSLNGQPYSLPTSATTNGPTFAFTPTAVGTYIVTLTVADPDGGSATVQQTVDITSMDPISLQNVVTTQAYWINEGTPYESYNSSMSGPLPVAVTLEADPSQINDALTALNALVQPTVYDSCYDAWSVPATVTLNLTGNSYTDVNFNLQPGVTVIVNGTDGTTVVGNSPALTITAGNVIINHVTFTTATDAPTILVTGGSLTLRHDVVQESTGFADAAIAVTGGVVDLGSNSSPGNNTVNVNGSGQLVQANGPGLVSAAGDTFQTNGAALNPVTSTTLTSSANSAFFNQPVTLTATVAALTPNTGTPTGIVRFFDQSAGTTLATVALSGGVARWTSSSLTPGSHTVLAVYSGDAKFITSSASLVENVNSFSGFLAPLSNNLAFNLNRVIPIKWQLGDSSGKAMTDLSAVVSLQVAPVQSGGVLGTPFTPTPSNGIGLRSDGKQYIFNWDTKGVAVGTYQIQLTLADGTVQTKTLQIVTKGGYAALVVDGTGGTATTGGLLAGDINLYVDNSNGDLTVDELARIQDAVAAVDAVTEPYGVVVQEVTDPAQADVTFNMDTTSAVGGYADGVLGCTTDAGQVTLIQGWSFYAGSDSTQVGSDQYDFQTVVTHELGHVLGLGHSADGSSVMYATLDTGAVKRALRTADLNVADTDSGSCGLHAQKPLLDVAAAGPTTNPGKRALPHGSNIGVAKDRLFVGWAGGPAPVREPAASLLGLGHPTDLTLPTDTAAALAAGQAPEGYLLSAWETAPSADASMDRLFADLGQDSELALWQVPDVPWFTNDLQSVRV